MTDLSQIARAKGTPTVKNNMFRRIRVSLLISSHNRREVLRQTIQGFLGLESLQANLDILVVDNNSTDGTFDMLQALACQGKLRCLREERPGKNIALNRALAEPGLGEIIAFSDDDVIPDPDWLEAIVDSTNRYPDAYVFGGRVNVLWGDSIPPAWAGRDLIDAIVFSAHHPYDFEGPYLEGRLPFGPNFWIRRQIIDAGFRYNENVGPRPKNRIMGSESTFLQELLDNGYAPMYIPSAVMGHLVDKQYLVRSRALQRGFRLGRSGPHLHGLQKHSLYRFSRLLWSGYLASTLTWHAMRFAFSYLIINDLNRFEHQLIAMMGIGAKYENLKLYWGSERTHA